MQRKQTESIRSLYNREKLFLLFPAFYHGSAAITVTQQVITSEWILPPAGAALWSARSNYGSGSFLLPGFIAQGFAVLHGQGEVR